MSATTLERSYFLVWSARLSDGGNCRRRQAPAVVFVADARRQKYEPGLTHSRDEATSINQRSLPCSWVQSAWCVVWRHTWQLNLAVGVAYWPHKHLLADSRRRLAPLRRRSARPGSRLSPRYFFSECVNT